MAWTAVKFLDGLKAASEAKLAAAQRACTPFSEKIIADAQAICPVDQRVNAPHPGFLRDSGLAEPAETDGEQIALIFGFNADYAVYVHERLDTFHPVGQAKFLEIAIRENQDRFAPFVAAAMRRADSSSSGVDFTFGGSSEGSD